MSITGPRWLLHDSAVSLIRVVDGDRHRFASGSQRPGSFSSRILDHASVITLSWSFYDGSINFNGVIPATGATGTYSVTILSYYYSFDFFGRSANVVTSLHYGVGNFQGTVAGAGEQLYRSGLLDSVYRFSVNLKGGPALAPQKFGKWRQKLLLGASLKVIESSWFV